MVAMNSMLNKDIKLLTKRDSYNQYDPYATKIGISEGDEQSLQLLERVSREEKGNGKEEKVNDILLRKKKSAK